MENDVLDLRRQWRDLKRGKWWFVVFPALFLALATAYCVLKPSQYEVKSSMLIEDNSGEATKMAGGMAQMMRTFSVGGFGAATVDNEQLLVMSHDAVRRMVKMVGLTHSYYEKTGFMQKELLFGNSPIEVLADQQALDTLPFTVRVKVKLHGGKADVTVSKGLFNTILGQAQGITLPAAVKTGVGEIQVLKTRFYGPAEDRTITATIANVEVVTDQFEKKVTVEQATKTADVINLTIYDDPKRGKAILNGIMEAYDQKRIEHKNEKANAEIDFVNGRIAELQGELSDVEGKVAQFKRQHEISNPTAEASGWLAASEDAQANATKLQTEITINEMVLKALRNTIEGDDALVPAFDGLNDPSIVKYNELVTRKREIKRSATDANETMVLLNQHIAELKQNILVKAEKSAADARIRLQAIYDRAGRARGKFNNLPSFEREYYDILRDRELKNDLYVFLLEKRENSKLSLTADVYPSFVIDPAFSSIKPYIMKKVILVLVALLMGLLLPLLWILLKGHLKDRLEEVFDLPQEVESHSLKRADAVDFEAELRARLLDFERVNRIFVADAARTGEVKPGDIAGALQRIGCEARVVSVGDIDSLCVLMRQPADADVIDVAGVPGQDVLATLPLMDFGDGDVLLLVVKTGSVRRAQLIKHLNAVKTKQIVVTLVD